MLYNYIFTIIPNYIKCMKAIPTCTTMFNKYRFCEAHDYVPHLYVSVTESIV